MNLLPVMVGATIVPLYPVVILLLLQSEGGLRKAIAFISGGVAMRLAQGVLFLAIDAKQWVFTLSAISIISEGELGLSTGLWLYLLYILVTQMLMLLSVLGRAIAPRQIAGPLEKGQAWLERNNRVII